MQNVVLIVAGGNGRRMQSELPKQFIELNGLPTLMHTIKQFYLFDEQMEIRLVLPPNQFEVWKTLVSKHNFRIEHKLYAGGETRFHSVKNGLIGLSSNRIIAIHDGVRPLVSFETIRQTFKTAIEKGTAIPVIDVHETLRVIEGEYSKTVDRDKYKLVQTPQVFRSSVLLKAYEQSYKDKFTDDASVVEAAGENIFLVEGNRENIKITTPYDLIIAEALMK